ncbi:MULTISPECIES: type IV pilin-like G/H family protein [Fischerella]|uniref:Uncharacterized protein n=1 Tax=Fischerella muscicola CCMEE 5323 TaxID=2019572 RepID=A0A2N6JVR6_FISMU|nr:MULTISPECIES: type IV pilin-like G/H family protein [Fischerella]MBD2431031.1 CD225/dispanin family protein [Fischerella sp. FACHB-380]PLZ83699.1 hypothetical protein CEN44_26180 [Fischerella muscicola CCMEE 5323]
MTQQNFLELAKQGDAQAIAFLINKQLKPKGITAKVALKDNCLQVMLESPQLQNEKALVDLIRKGITNLGTKSIERVKVYGRQTGEDFPTWSQDFSIGNLAEYEELESNIISSQAKTVTLSNFSIFNTSADVASRVQFDSKASCPRTYLVPSILVTLFAFLPVGVAAIIFATQVEGKYNQGDYDGAKSTSNTAKILCLVSAGIAAPFYLLFILLIFGAILLPSTTNQLSKAKQSEAKQNIGAINRAQQAFYLENTIDSSNGNFSSTLSDLGIGIRPETQNYIYEINVDDTKAIATATAKTSGIKSYVGAVYKIKTEVLSVDETLTIAKLCESNQPSTTPPGIPELMGKEIICAAGSSDPSLK